MNDGCVWGGDGDLGQKARVGEEGVRSKNGHRGSEVVVWGRGGLSAHMGTLMREVETPIITTHTRFFL